MPIELTDADRAVMSPEEIEALTSPDAESHLGHAAPDDAQASASTETPAPESATASNDAGKAQDGQEPPPVQADGAAGEQAPQGGQQETAQAQDDAQRETPFVPTFQGRAPENYAQHRQELLAKKAEAFQKLMDGEIDAKEYVAIETEVQTQLDDLQAARIRAETLIEANTQTQLAIQQREIQRIIKSAKAAGELDYVADQDAQVQFDAVLGALQASPANAGKDFAELADQAHRAVLAMRGIGKAEAPAPTPAPAPAAPAPAAAQKQPELPPRTLAGLPTAGHASIGDDIAAKLATLQGEDAERFIASLPPAQVERLLRASGAV